MATSGNEAAQKPDDINKLANPKRIRSEMYEDDDDFQSEIKSLLLSLSSKIASMNTDMAGYYDRLNAKIDNLEGTLNTKILLLRTIWIHAFRQLKLILIGACATPR